LSDLFFTSAAPPLLDTLSLHDALPISWRRGNTSSSRAAGCASCAGRRARRSRPGDRLFRRATARSATAWPAAHRSRAELFRPARSEEHTSELQSRFDLVCRLLLEKKKQ